MSKNDEAILTLINKIEEKKASLGKRPIASWKTCGVFRYYNDPNKFFNINTVVNSEQFVEAVSTMIMYDEVRRKSCEMLGVDPSSITMPMWNGYTLTDWIHDFKLRISIIQWDNEKRKLEDMDKKLKGLVSEEAKTGMEIDAISKALGI